MRKRARNRIFVHYHTLYDNSVITYLGNYIAKSAKQVRPCDNV